MRRERWAEVERLDRAVAFQRLAKLLVRQRVLRAGFRRVRYARDRA